MFIKKILLFIIFFTFYGSVFWLDVSPKIEKAYSKIFTKINLKSTDKLKLESLLKLKSKIELVAKSNKYKNNSKIINVLAQVTYLNNKAITLLQKKLILNNIKEQKKVETVEDINTEFVNYENEFKNEKTERKKIIDLYEYTKLFKNISYTKNHIFLENGVWKAYVVKEYSYFENNLKITSKDLIHNNIDVNKALIFVTEKNTVWFVHNPKKVTLISDYIIKDVENKYYLLWEILDDVKNAPNIDYDKTFLEIKEIVKKFNLKINDKSKILNIYNYVLKNVKYSPIIDFKNYKIFSWIETFKNNDWVCEGYAKLMVYMLMFAWINDVEAIRWYVIDASDFPDVWHAWVRVWDRFFDPTFDDPVWAISDKNYSSYKYFNLPKDLFYTNRFDQESLPDDIKIYSLEKRKKIILDNLFKISTKYKNEDYKLLDIFKFKKKYKINYSEKISLSNLWKILPLRKVDNFRINDNWNSKQITKLSYYSLEKFNFEAFFEQIDYDLDWYYFLDWVDKDWNRSYKLGYDIELQ